MEDYIEERVIGRGSYGVVVKCKHRVSGQVVAIKQFTDNTEHDLIRKTAIREARILKQLWHPNVVRLLELFRSKTKLYMVFEYMDRSILKLLEAHPRGLPLIEVKKILWQMLQALTFLHSQQIIHRDLKPENVLIDEKGTVKLCDFGFARPAGPGQNGNLSPYVATRWYRAPELLVGDKYGPGVDVWAFGCLLVELLSGMPLFPGKSNVDQLWQIMRAVPCTARQLSVMRDNPALRQLRLPNDEDMKPLEKRYNHFDRSTIAMLKACLAAEPGQRPSCVDLMKCEFFTSAMNVLEPYRVKVDIAAAAAAAAEAAAAMERKQRASRTGDAGGGHNHANGNHVTSPQGSTPTASTASNSSNFPQPAAPAAHPTAPGGTANGTAAGQALGAGGAPVPFHFRSHSIKRFSLGGDASGAVLPPGKDSGSLPRIPDLPGSRAGQPANHHHHHQPQHHHNHQQHPPPDPGIPGEHRGPDPISLNDKLQQLLQPQPPSGPPPPSSHGAPQARGIATPMRGTRLQPQLLPAAPLQQHQQAASTGPGGQGPGAPVASASPFTSPQRHRGVNADEEGSSEGELHTNSFNRRRTFAGGLGEGGVRLDMGRGELGGRSMKGVSASMPSLSLAAGGMQQQPQAPLQQQPANASPMRLSLSSFRTVAAPPNGPGSGAEAAPAPGPWGWGQMPGMGAGGSKVMGRGLPAALPPQQQQLLLQHQQQLMQQLMMMQQAQQAQGLFYNGLVMAGPAGSALPRPVSRSGTPNRSNNYSNA